MPRIVWGAVPVLVAGVLLLSGGLDALRSFSIVAAFPFIVLMTFMAAALLRSVRGKRRRIELHDALLRERMQRMLDIFEPHEASAAGETREKDDHE